MRTREFVCAVAVAIVVSASLAVGQGIQKWKTPDGKLYFGDRPPRGSTKIGEEGSKERAKEDAAPTEQEPSAPSPAAERAAEREKLSIEASRARTAMERNLNRHAERIAEIDKKIAIAARQPDFVQPWMERQASIKNEKALTLQGLETERKATLTAIADVWKKFDELDARVRKAYDGKAPDWWRGTLRCAACPTRAEAEAALE